MTPLVDVIFLLLLFFMLTSTFSRYAEIEVSAATGGGASAAGTGDLQFLRLGPDDVRLGARTVPMDALAGELAEARVLVSLAEGVDAQRLVDLLAVLRPVPDLQLTVLR